MWIIAETVTNDRGIAHRAVGTCVTFYTRKFGPWDNLLSFEDTDIFVIKYTLQRVYISRLVWILLNQSDFQVSVNTCSIEPSYVELLWNGPARDVD